MTHTHTEPTTAPARPELKLRELTDHDRRVLAAVPRDGYSMRAKHTVWYVPEGSDAVLSTHREIAEQWTGALLDEPSAVIVYVSRHDGSIQFGVARLCRPAGRAGYVENTYEIEPFPGGWELVGESQIVAVRHTHAL